MYPTNYVLFRNFYITWGRPLIQPIANSVYTAQFSYDTVFYEFYAVFIQVTINWSFIMEGLWPLFSLYSSSLSNTEVFIQDNRHAVAY